MATCLQTIQQTDITSIPTLEPGQNTTYSVAAGISTLFLIPSSTFQTISFNISSTSLPTNVVFTFFKNNGASYSNIGSATITSANSSFTIDLQAGEYILCIRGPVSAQSGSFLANFTSYSVSYIFRPRFFTGENVVAILYKPPIIVDCDKPIFFRMTDGVLPPGITLSGQGVLFGQLPNMDCLDDRTNYSPGMNWYFTDNEGNAFPWGRQWRFKVKAWVDGFEDSSSIEDWFCIRVHNNWTLDQEKFLAQAPFETVKEIRVIETAKALPESVCVPCEKEVETMFVPVKIDADTCEPCKNTNADIVELIQIPTEISNIKVSDIITWYEINKNNPSNSSEVNDFISALSNSENFKILRSKAGFVTNEVISEVEKETTYIAVEQYMNFLQLAKTRLDPDQDKSALQYQIREWNIYQNHILPFWVPFWHGEFMTCEIIGDFHVNP